MVELELRMGYLGLIAWVSGVISPQYTPRCLKGKLQLVEQSMVMKDIYIYIYIHMAVILT